MHARMSHRKDRLHLHGPLLKHLPIPQCSPALHIMAPHRVGTPKAGGDLSQPLLRASGVPPEYDRAWLGGEQRRELVRKRGLLCLVEEVEEGRCVDRGDVPQ